MLFLRLYRPLYRPDACVAVPLCCTGNKSAERAAPHGPSASTHHLPGLHGAPSAVSVLLPALTSVLPYRPCSKKAEPAAPPAPAVGTKRLAVAPAKPAPPAKRPALAVPVSRRATVEEDDEEEEEEEKPKGLFASLFGGR